MKSNRQNTFSEYILHTVGGVVTREREAVSSPYRTLVISVGKVG